jgi:phospholipid/cholesterol/gamma-HCH transport system substrate-binding protein
MKNTRTIEITVGIFVALGMAALLMLAMKVANLSQFTEQDGYEVRAYFDNVGGLQTRSAVKMGGVTIGRVTAIGFDQSRFQAVVTMSIDQAYNHIPAGHCSQYLHRRPARGAVHRAPKPAARKWNSSRAMS